VVQFALDYHGTLPKTAAMKAEVFPRLDALPRWSNSAPLAAPMALARTYPDAATLAALADPYFGRCDHEVLVLAGMNSRYHLIWIECISQQDMCVRITQKMLRAALARPRTFAVFLAHNHPSGIALPSQNDIVFTQKCGRIIRGRNQILLDHIIKGEGHWGSMRAMGYV
jgi:hypothetical protein